MCIKGIATVPTAFQAGIIGVLGPRLFARWAYFHAIDVTRPLQFALYVILYAVPFLFLVIGLDRARWDPSYDWFGQTAKMESRRMWIRWGAYFVVCILASAVR
jgi:hypothetical protein